MFFPPFFQSFLRRIQKTGLIKHYFSDESFRKSYRLMQSLAYLPEEDVIEGFLKVKQNINENFVEILEYFERVYVGNLKPLSRTARCNARFPISTWNLYKRVINKMPKTNNSVESWHSQISQNCKKHLTVNQLTELLRKEQSNMENNLTKLDMGEVKKRANASVKKDNNLYNLCINYKRENMFKFLENVSLNLKLDNILLND